MPKTATTAKAAPNPYSVHPGVRMVQDWIATLKAKTGRSLPEWLDLMHKKGPKDEVALRAWLKGEHGLGTNSAWWLAERALGKGGEEDTPERYLAQAQVYVEEMFAGAKAPLRPLYEELLRLGLAIGPEAKACPCKTMVPLYRNHVFAQIKPATRTRIDFGFALGDLKAKGRLIDTGGFAKKDRITHRIEVTGPADVDGELRRWLQTAYDRDA
jgi:hypothetical protein